MTTVLAVLIIMPDIAWINGSFCPLSEAMVPVEDRGFQFADGVYEVIIAPGGKLFLFDKHLQRLRRSLAGIHLDVDIDALGLTRLVAEGVKRAGYQNGLVYIQISGGAGPRNHVRPPECPHTLVMTFRQYSPIEPARFDRGVALAPAEDTRWSKPCIKAIALLPNVLLRHEAMQRGFDDAILLGPDNIVRETTCANIFAVFGDTLWTPPVSDRILRGITRDYLLSYATGESVAVMERDKTIDELLDADEVFVTSTTQEAMPVLRIGDRTIGNGKPGPMTTRFAQGMRVAVMSR